MPDAPARLERLLISEVSGVDDPANELPGWMVTKARPMEQGTALERTCKGLSADAQAQLRALVDELAAIAMGDPLTQALAASKFKPAAQVAAGVFKPAR
jgi:hypothetical protein